MNRAMRIGAVAAVMLAAWAARPASAQTAVRAFEPYEAIRAALAVDSLKGVGEQAALLAPLAGELAGADAKQASERLAQASDLKTAREAFGVLSKALVPKLREANLPDVYAFECSMVKLPWVQRGDKVQNPYLGKSMPTCGTPMKGKSVDR